MFLQIKKAYDTKLFSGSTVEIRLLSFRVFEVLIITGLLLDVVNLGAFAFCTLHDIGVPIDTPQTSTQTQEFTLGFTLEIYPYSKIKNPGALVFVFCVWCLVSNWW